ncbi:hypothetical protein MRX96_002783 [Rhipicephalus microplus]
MAAPCHSTRHPLVAVAPTVLAAPSAVSYAYTHRVHAPLTAAYPLQYVIG